MVKKKLPHLLIVGGTGFIGYNLALSAKKKGWRVSSVSLNKPKKHRYVYGVNYLKIDITNYKDLKKKLKGSFTHVINLSGYVKHSVFKGTRNKIIETHFIGLINLTKIFLDKKIKKFIQIGSSSEYGDANAPQREDLYGFSNSSYALAKLASTKFLKMLFYTQKFPIIILRLFQVYGPKQDENRVLPQIIKGCLSNKTFPVSHGNQVRDFCYIDDVINAIFLAFKCKKFNGEIFNIGSGQPRKIKNVIRKIIKIIGKGKVQFGKIKYRKDENLKLYPNLEKTRRKLKWKSKINFDRGIRIVINSLR